MGAGEEADGGEWRVGACGEEYRGGGKDLTKSSICILPALVSFFSPLLCLPSAGGLVPFPVSAVIYRVCLFPRGWIDSD